MNSTERQNQRGEFGVTVVELLIVIVVIAIVAGMALMRRGPANEQFQRQNVARDLKTAFERARFDSVKRRAQASGTATLDTRARVVITANNFTLVTDNNMNGDLVLDDDTFDSGDSVVTTFSSNIVVAGSGINLPVTVYFDQRGEAKAISSSGTNPVFYVCNISCSSLDNSNADLLLVTPTGTVNLLPGNATPPTFAPPNGITTVPAGTSIRSDVTID